MNRFNHFFGIVLLFSVLSCANAQDPVIKRLNNEEFESLMEKDNLQLIDVRTPREYQQGYIKGSKLIDYNNKNFTTELSKLDINKPIAIYCAVGGRSGRTLPILKELGFKEIYDLRNGIKGWSQSGKEIVK